MKAAAPPPTERPTLLMVESDVLVRQAIAEYLRECGYRVLEAANTDEAILIINARKVETVLANARAGGKLDGFGLAKWLKDNRPGVQVILSGTVANHAKEAGKLCDKGPPLVKPYDPKHLVDRIKRAMAARERSRKPGPRASLKQSA